MLTSAQILEKLRAKCEVQGDCWIWHDGTTAGRPKLIRMNDHRHTPSKWYFLAKNELEDLPDNSKMETLCETPLCISHAVPITIHLGALSDMTEFDLEYLAFRLDRIAEKKEDCVLVTKLALVEGGYAHANFFGKHWYCHILVRCVLDNIDEIPNGYEVAHSCGVRNCIAPKHLRIATKKQNAADKIEHGTDQRGIHHPNASITEEKAREIIASISSGKSVSERAKEFSVSTNIVRDIDYGKSWKHLLTDEQKANRRQSKRKNVNDNGQQTKRARVDISLKENTAIRLKIFKQIKKRIKKNIKIVKMDDYDTAHWIWQLGLTKQRYGDYGLKNAFPMTAATSHRASWQAFNGIILDAKTQVRHKCQQRRCCNPSHLECGTVKQNAEDKIRDGTSRKGESNPQATISDETARQIKASKGDGTAKERAERFECSEAVVAGIDQGTTWKHI